MTIKKYFCTIILIKNKCKFILKRMIYFKYLLILIVKNQKGNNLLLFNGYLHNIDEKYENKIVWRCTEYKKLSCKSRCHTTTNTESGTKIK